MVQHIDWRQRSVLVTPTEQQGRTTWLGGACGLSSTLATEIKNTLLSDDEPAWLSARAREELEQSKDEFAFLNADATTFTRQTDEGYVWHTYAGRAVNQVLAGALERRGVSIEKHDDFTIAFGSSVQRAGIENVLNELTSEAVMASIELDDDAREQLKFSVCVPDALLHREIASRACAAGEIEEVLRGARVFIECA